MELTINKELLGQIILNISFFIYCVQFIPQIMHNVRSKTSLSNISIFTQFGIFITVLCDIVETVGFGDEWQYAAVAIIYLLGVCIQQLQISFYHKKMPEIANLTFIILFTIAMLAMGSSCTLVYKSASYIGFFINITYWLPQIFKNYKQKRSDGFCLTFILLGLIGTCLYLLSAMLFPSDLTFKINAAVLLPIIIILIYQKYLYRSFNTD